jgi:glycosyltransferase involved in cell wall biosynthesis
MVSTVSVIIPTFNRPQALSRSIESALAQTHLPLEILVCEDGSSTDTERIVASFDTPQVKWLPALHAGRPAIPRNRGIHAARGEWLAFLDDDDVWLPEKLEKQVKLAKATGYKAICANAWKVQDEKRKGYYFSKPQNGKIIFKQLLRTNLVICSSAIFHRSLLEKVKGFPEVETLLALEDYALWLRIAVFTNFGYIPEPLLEYIDEPSQSIRNKEITEREQRLRVFQDFSAWARNARVNPHYILQTQAVLLLQDSCGLCQCCHRLLISVKKFFL